MSAYLQSAREAIDEAVGRLSVEALQRKVDGRWSIAEILEHLTLVFDANAAALKKALASGELRARRPTFKQTLGRILVVDLGYFPRVEAPLNRPPKRLQLKATRLIPVRPSIPPPYVPCNPSILLTTDGYLVNCRGVDIRRRRSRRRGGEDEVVIRSRNVLMRFSLELELLDQHPMVIDEPPLRDTSIRGLEDCRLFEVDGAVCFLCATADRHPSGHIHLSVCQLEPDGRVSAHRPLVGAFDDRPQKNWLPFVGADGAVRAIYGYAPLTVLRLDVFSGRYEVDVQVRHRRRARTWRGSAGPVSIPDSDRRLMLVHDVIIRNRPGGRSERTYLHRFIECDAAFSLTRVSRPFVFVEEGIEFACGMTLSHNGANLVIGLGVQDNRAYLCQVPLAEVERMLSAPLKGWTPCDGQP